MSFRMAILKSFQALKKLSPIILGVILLMGLVNALIPKSFYASIFTKNFFIDSIIGASLGSIMSGNPITSYILSGEFLQQGVSLLAVTAFLLAWVTVGIIQLPAEAMILGKKFALLRNLLSFLSAIVIAWLAILILRII